MKPRNQTIEYFRLAACIFVVFIHARFPNPAGLWIVGIGRFAVPFFAVVSGYFCQQGNTEKNLSHIRIRLKKTVLLTVAASAAAAVSNCAAGILSGNGCFTWITGALSVTAIRNFFLFNRAVFLNSAIWYLFAAIYAYILLFFLVKSGLIRYMLPIAAGLLVFNLWYCEFTAHPWYYCGNFLFEVLPFMVIGYHFEKLKRIPVPFPVPIFLLCAGCGLCVWEVSVFYNDAPLYIGSVISALAIFRICVESPRYKSTILSKAGTALSMPIYVLHCCVLAILLSLYPDLSASVFYPPAVLLLTVIISLLFVMIQRALPLSDIRTWTHSRDKQA